MLILLLCHLQVRPLCSNTPRLWLDARVVDVLRLFNLMRVTLSSLQPFFGNGLKKVWHFSEHVGTEDPGIQEERPRKWSSGV